MTTTKLATVAEIAAAWIAELRWEDVPEPVRDSLHEGMLQSIAGGVAGLRTPEAQIALDMARREGETGTATIYGDGLKVPVATAVLVNALMFCALEQQEMHVESGTHPYQTIVPAALVVCEGRQVSGEEFLTAVLAGTEVMLALAIIGLSVTVGWGMELSHTSAVYGAVGTAATVAKLLKLDATATANALGHAANLAAGVTEGLWAGTTEYHWALANGARVGHLAVLLARSGAESAPAIFEGRAGFLHRFSEISGDQLADADIPGKLTARLGKVWETPAHIYKRYPVHFNNLPYVDAARILREKHRIASADITAIRLTINRWCELCDGGNLGPYHGREATRGATAFGVATMLARGRYSLVDAEDHDAPDINDLVRRTTILTYADPAESRDWRSLRVEVDAPQTYVYDGKIDGVLDYRLPLDELRAIADDALLRVLGRAQTTKVLDRLDALDRSADMRELIGVLAPGEPVEGLR